MATITHEYVPATVPSKPTKFSSLKDGATIVCASGYRGSKLGSAVVRPQTQVEHETLVAPKASDKVVVVGHAIPLAIDARPSVKLAKVIAAKGTKPSSSNSKATKVNLNKLTKAQLIERLQNA